MRGLLANPPRRMIRAGTHGLITDLDKIYTFCLCAGSLAKTPPSFYGIIGFANNR